MAMLLSERLGAQATVDVQRSPEVEAQREKIHKSMEGDPKAGVKF
jgi:hypothetical protein